MRFVVLGLVMNLLLALPAYAACTGPSGVSGSVDYDDATKTQKICDNTTWKMIEEIDYTTGTGAAIRTQIGADAGSCNAAKTGRLNYTGGSSWTYCNGTSWVPLQRGSCTGPSSCPAIGNVCTDGTVFIGCPAPTYYRTYMTRCDAGQTWSGSACTGTRIARPWNNGNTTGLVSVAVTGLDGLADTNLLVATDSNSASGGTQPHQAAAYCDTLTLHSKSDWYLPSRPEMWQAFIYKTAIGNFSNTAWYWTTGQVSAQQAWYQEMGDGVAANADKSNLPNQRCARRD